MAGHGVVSADSHMMEPADLWKERLDVRFRDRAPEVIQNPNPDGPKYLFTAEGAPPFPVAGGFAAGRSGEELAEFMNEGYEAARPSGWDPVERIKDQEIDGLDAEVLYPTLGMTTFSMPDGALQRACFTVYNDWLAEFCRYDPKRLYGIGLISLEEIDTAVKDVESIAKQGMKGAMIWGSPPVGRPYSDRSYDRFWQAISDQQLPVSLHIITGRGRQAERLGDALEKWGGEEMLDPGVTYTTMIHEIQETLATLIFGGVLERFPELRIVSAENDVGWLPHMMYRMDHAFDKYSAIMSESLSMRPSEYVRRQIWATFQDDAVGAATYGIFGEDNYMWASDFPHTDSTFPESHAWIDKNFEGVPDAVRQKIVHDNAINLYRMDLDSP